jgi:hypothetical protein
MLAVVVVGRSGVVRCNRRRIRHVVQ